MQIKLTEQEKLQYFYNSLCNGLNWISGYGLYVKYNQNEYKQTSQKLKAKNPKIEVCYEDVLIEMLKDGKKLKFVDEECDGEYTRTIGLNEVLSNIEKTPIRNLLNIHEEQDDAEDADAVIQSVLYSEIIFG